MPPEPLTVAAPSLTSQRAGPPSFWLTQRDKSLPSNKTMASDGGGPGSMTRGSSFGGGISPGSPAKPLHTANAIAPKTAREWNKGILIGPTAYQARLQLQPENDGLTGNYLKLGFGTQRIHLSFE